MVYSAQISKIVGIWCKTVFHPDVYMSLFYFDAVTIFSNLYLVRLQRDQSQNPQP